MKIKAIKTRVFQENEDLIPFILKYIKKIPEKSVLVITSKIVALAEGRVVDIYSRMEHETMLRKIILAESDHVFGKTKLTIKDGMPMYAGGIDESNANGKIVLLPKDSFRTAESLRKKLKNIYKVKDLGVLITDSCFLPLRTGAVAAAVGYAGFKGVKNYIGEKDIFGRVLKMSRTNVADSLATSAVLLMGEGKEQQPLAMINEAPVVFVDKINKKEMRFKAELDMFYTWMKHDKYFQNKKNGKRNKKK